MSQPSALEPFDEMLSLKVQSLSQNAETITDQVIKARKGIPSRRAEALKRLQKARLELDGLREEERDQHRERLVEKWEEGESQVGGEYFVVGVERREREREDWRCWSCFEWKPLKDTRHTFGFISLPLSKPHTQTDLEHPLFMLFFLYLLHRSSFSREIRRSQSFSKASHCRHSKFTSRE